MVFGGAFYGFIIASITSVTTEADANTNAYYEKMGIVHSCVNQRDVMRCPPGVR